MKVNGKKIRKLNLNKGYAVVTRKWKEGDKLELVLPMPVSMLTGDPRIEDTHGKVVLMRGPIVYCIEELDNETYFDENNDVPMLSSGLKAEFQKDLLGGITTITGNTSLDNFNITAIPYYAWNNRGQGQMKVWLPYTKQ